MIVAQARSPAFYVDYQVPDTVHGRFEMIVLHLVLFLRRFAPDAGSRTAADSGAARKLGQGLFDAFCSDLDDNLREMGVGDLTVPKEMRRFGEAFYGRQRAYGAALDAGDTAELEKALARNILGSPGSTTGPCGWRAMRAPRLRRSMPRRKTRWQRPDRSFRVRRRCRMREHQSAKNEIGAVALSRGAR